MSDTYSLRLYNTELMRFSLEKRGLDGLIASIISVQEEYAPLMPLDLERTSEGIIRWLSKRVIPKNRTFVDQILKTLHLSHNDTKGIIDVCKGLSLNDSYWVVPEGFEGTFEAYNLYENRFSEILALVAYTGAGQSHEAFTTSPELTTSGMLPKAWRLIEGDGIYLYKGGTRGASNSGREPYCEAYAFIPIGRIVRTGGIQACLDYYDALGREFGEQLRSMLVFDALIYNEDRHFGNFGLLRDNHTGQIIAPAPIFDNGLSLMALAGKDDLDSFSHFEAYAKMRTNPYQVSYEDICYAVMGPVQKAQLRRMIGFQFHHYPAGMVTEVHLDYLEKLLESRVQNLLNIPIRKQQKGSREQGAR